MPIYEDYLSDASLTTESDSDNEEEVDLYDERDKEYWNIEAFLEDYCPPPAIEYAQNLGVVALYGCVTDPLRSDIATVVPSDSVTTWRSYWSSTPEEIRNNAFSHDEWDNIGRWCMQLCECCVETPNMVHIRSCMIRLMEHGRFIRPLAGRVVSPAAVRRYLLRR